MGKGFVYAAGIALVLCAIVIYVVAHRLPQSSSDTPSAPNTPAAPVPSRDDKVAAVHDYYADISSENFDRAYTRVVAGSYPSKSALSSSYCQVAKIAATESTDVRDSRSLSVTIVGYSRTGTPTTYAGTISFALDSNTGSWLLNRPDLTRTAGPKLVNLPCRTTVDLADVSGGLAYTLAGQGNGGITLMDLQVDNRTDRSWSVKIKAGTRLESDDSSVQRMVVTKDTEVEVEPHEHKSIEVHVACLDIVKDAPPSAGTQWTVIKDSTLAQFITCSGIAPENVELQGALWVARGASRDDLMHQAHKAQDVTDDVAGQFADQTLAQFQPVVERCGSLASTF